VPDWAAALKTVSKLVWPKLGHPRLMWFLSHQRECIVETPYFLTFSSIHVSIDTKWVLWSPCLEDLLMVGYCMSAVLALAMVQLGSEQRSSHLVGFGLVVGLKGTGSQGTFTQQVNKDTFLRTLVTALIQRNLKLDDAVKPGNTAAVIVTADLGPDARVGNRVEVTISALDDSKSLANGTLILTYLQGVDSKEYCVAIGPVKDQSVQNMPVARIANGAIVLRQPRRHAVPFLQLDP
jgi:hypothetical protein